MWEEKVEEEEEEEDWEEEEEEDDDDEGWGYEEEEEEEEEMLDGADRLTISVRAMSYQIIHPLVSLWCMGLEIKFLTQFNRHMIHFFDPVNVLKRF